MDHGSSVEHAGAVLPGPGSTRRGLTLRGFGLGALLAGLTGCAATAPVTSSLAAGLVQPRTAAPAVGGVTLAGQKQRLADLAPAVVVLNFYASWCEPCRTEAPYLARLARQEAGTGVNVVGVLEQDTASHGLRFSRDYGLPYPSLTDPGGAILHSFHVVDVGGLPVTVAVDRGGRVAARWLGPLTGHPDFRRTIQALAAEPPP